MRRTETSALATAPVKVEAIAARIVLVRGQKVLLDADLAVFYGVQTRALVQAVERNLDRFPDDFMFQLSNQELAVLRSQTVISSATHGGRFASCDEPSAFHVRACPFESQASKPNHI